MDVSMVTVLIVTWNRRDDVLETIDSVYSQAYRDFEIIVVDNGSEDGTVGTIASRYPEVRLVALENNVGASRARNFGIEIARGEFILFLDSDASPSRDTLANLVKKLKTTPDLGVINSKIVNANTNQIDDIAGWIYTEKDKDFQDVEFLSYSFSEGGCAIKKEVFDKVGPFWDKLFFGYEGMELALRVLDAGYTILYYPPSLVLHRASPHARIKGGSRERILLKSCLMVYLLRFPWWMLIVFVPMKTVTAFLHAARHGYFLEMLGAWKDFLLQFRSVMRERKPIRNETAIHYLKLQRQHGPLSRDFMSWIGYKA